MIKNLVKEPHWINRRYSPFWDFLLQSYEGGIDYTNARILNQGLTNGLYDSQFRYFVNGVQQDTRNIYGNLFMHTKEKVEDYNRRVGMSYYYNFCAPVCDIYADHLFRQAVNEDWEELEDIMMVVGNDIDRRGASVQEFRKQMSDMAQIHGHCFVISDSPQAAKISKAVRTRKDQMETRAFPYVSLYRPNDLINWALDEYGQPYWILLRDCYDKNEDPKTFDKDKTTKYEYRLWTRTTWEIYNEDFELIGAGINPLGEVPITCVYDRKSMKVKNFLGLSQIADISLIARDIYNASSELRQILRDQTFAFLALEGSSEEYAALTLGTGKGLIYPEGRKEPKYISPPTDNATVYFDHIDRQISKIFSIAKIDAGIGGQAKSAPSGGASVDSQSGISKAWSFNQTNSSLSTKASFLEDAEMRIWTHFAAWDDKTFTGSVQYPNDFSISDLQSDLNECEQESRLGLGKTFNVEIRKAIVKKKFPRMDDEKIEEMAQEIEELQTQKPSSSMADRVKKLFGGNIQTSKGEAESKEEQGAGKVDGNEAEA